MRDKMSPPPELPLAKLACRHTCLRVQLRAEDSGCTGGVLRHRLMLESTVNTHGIFADESFLTVRAANSRASRRKLGQSFCFAEQRGFELGGLVFDVLQHRRDGGDIGCMLSTVLKLGNKLLLGVLQRPTRHWKIRLLPDLARGDVCKVGREVVVRVAMVLDVTPTMCWA